MPRLSRPSHTAVVAYLALFVALGGSSYAAVKITGKQVRDASLTGADVRNSSLTGSDLRDGSLLAGDFKAGQLPKGATGAQGLAGLAGAPGANGATGAQGPAGATPAAVGDSIDAPAAADGLMATGATTLVTAVAGNVLVFGQETLLVKCPNAAIAPCSFSAGLYLDGAPVADSGLNTTLAIAEQLTFKPDLFGLVKNVPAGTHTITVGWKSSTAAPNHATAFAQSDQRSAAVFVGG
jgi:hypothetical protein